MLTVFKGGILGIIRKNLAPLLKKCPLPLSSVSGYGPVDVSIRNNKLIVDGS